MKKKNFALLCLILSFILLFSSCGEVKKQESKPVSEYKIGVSSLTGNFNPFYAENEGDRAVIDKLFGKIRSLDSKNRPQNNFGSISYEYTSDDRVKYTVTIDKNIRFFSGNFATIDDVIFAYYLLADSSYDGVYSSWHNNDIEGLEEYYLNEDVTQISGINKINDYACTVLFNSADINAAQALNVYIVEKSFYAADYTKGNADSVKQISSSACGCGEYFIEKCDENSVCLKINPYYSKQKPENEAITFVKVNEEEILNSLLNKQIDTASVYASKEILSNLSSNSLSVKARNAPFYCSVFYNSRLNLKLRQALFSLCGDSSSLNKAFGNGYTRLYCPLSIKNEEYPGDITATYYKAEDFENEFSYLSKSAGELNAGILKSYCEIEKQVFNDYIQALGEKGFSVNLKEYGSLNELSQAAKNDELDFWFSRVEDNGTADKYDYYHSEGLNNLTGINDTDLDEAVFKLHSAIAFVDINALTREVIIKALDLAIECPLYQQQILDINR